MVGSWYVTSQAELFPMHLENACSGVEISILADTDDAFELDGDGVDDRLDGDLSKTVGDEDAWGDSRVNLVLFFCEITGAVLVNDYFTKETPA